MSVRKITALVVLSGLSGACVNASYSRVAALSGAQKPEGFLVVVDIVSVKDKPDQFLVTCAGSGGSTRSEEQSLEKIEANQICQPNSTVAPADKAIESSGASGMQLPVSITYAFSAPKESFIKARPNMNISGSSASYNEGTDFCTAPSEFGAEGVCRAGSEYYVSGISVAGCSLKQGYIYPAHFEVQPANVPECR